MRLTTVLPVATGLIAGYVLGTALHHPRVQQALFDLAGRASSNAARIPGPASDLVDAAATHVQDTLTQPEHEPDRPTSAPAEPVSERHVV